MNALMGSYRMFRAVAACGGFATSKFWCFETSFVPGKNGISAPKTGQKIILPNNIS